MNNFKIKNFITEEEIEITAEALEALKNGKPFEVEEGFSFGVTEKLNGSCFGCPFNYSKKFECPCKKNGKENIYLCDEYCIVRK